MKRTTKCVALDVHQTTPVTSVREELARVRLTRKLAALTLRLWTNGGRYHPTQWTRQAGEDQESRGAGVGAFPHPAAPGSRTTGRGAVSSRSFARPAVSPRHSSHSRPPRRTRTSVRPAACRVADRTMVRVVRPERLPPSRPATPTRPPMRGGLVGSRVRLPVVGEVSHPGAGEPPSLLRTLTLR